MLVPRKFAPIWSFSHFEAAVTRRPLKNQSNGNNVLYVDFYELSDDMSYFSKEGTWNLPIFDNKIVL